MAEPGSVSLQLQWLNEEGTFKEKFTKNLTVM